VTENKIYGDVTLVLDAIFLPIAILKKCCHGWKEYKSIPLN
jgi:hypothetical protein